MEKILQIGVEIQKIAIQSLQTKLTKDKNRKDNYPPLFMNSSQFENSPLETSFCILSSIDQEAFFGRTCGFQYSDAFRQPLISLAVTLASYNEGYVTFSPNQTYFILNVNLHGNIDHKASINSISSSDSTHSPKKVVCQTTKSLVYAYKYLIDPEKRAQKISNMLKNSNIDFTKDFARLVQTSISNTFIKLGTKMLTSTFAINIVKKIKLNSTLKLPKFYLLKTKPSVCKKTTELVDVSPPVGSKPNDTIKIRIMSYEKFHGMVRI